MKNKLLTAALGLAIAVIPATSGADATVLLPDTREAVVVDFTTGKPRVTESNMYSAQIRKTALDPSDRSLTYIDPHETFKLQQNLKPKTAITLSTGNRWAYNQIRSDEANALGYDGTGIKVAFLDSGLDETSPSLVTQNRLVAYQDFVDNLPGLRVHGTLTTGVVSSVVDAESGAGGVARGADIYMARVCASYPVNCPNTAIDKGFAWALNHDVDVISISLGGRAMGSSGIGAMIRWATTHGVSVVIAAGNDGCTAESSGGVLRDPYNQACRNKAIDSYPAKFPIPGLIEVGALDRTMSRAFFSSWGENLDIMAPGVDVMTSGPVNFEFSGGTSLATPMVAGVVALIKQAAPSLSPAQIQAVIEASAQPVNETKPNVWNSCSWSSVTHQWTCDYSFVSTLQQQSFTGAGCVDAVAAINLAKAIHNNTALAAPTVSNLTSSPTTASANISWSAITGATSYTVLQNQKIVGVTNASTTNFTLSNLIGGSSSAIQIQINGGASNGTRTAPALLQTYPDEELAAPQIATLNANYESIFISLSTPFVKDPKASYLVAAALLSDGQGLSCQMPNTTVDITCTGLTPKPGLTVQIAFMAPNGSLGALSEPFAVQYIAADDVQFTSVIDNHDLSVTLTFTHSSGAPNGYMYVATPKFFNWTYTDQSTLTIDELTYGWPYNIGVCTASASHEVGNHCTFRTVVLFPPDLGLAAITAKTASTTNTITFSVSIPAGTQGYNVYRSDGKVFSTGGTTFIDSEPNAMTGKSFKYRIMPWRYFNGGNSIAQFGMPSPWFTAAFAGRAPRPSPSRSTTPTPVKPRAALPSLPASLAVGGQATIYTGNAAGSIATVSVSIAAGSRSCSLIANKTGTFVTSYTLKANTYNSAGCTLNLTAIVNSRTSVYQSNSGTGVVAITQ